MKSLVVLFILVAVIATSDAHAEIVLSSDFNNHTSIDGATQFTGIQWVYDGISTPSPTIDYFESGFVELDGAPENAHRLGIQPAYANDNIFFFVLFTPLSDLTISNLTFDYQLLNADGTNATVALPNAAVINGGVHDFTTGGVGPVIGDSSFGLDPRGSDDPSTNSGSVVVNFFDTHLNGGQPYGFRFGIAPGGMDYGNRIAIDNLTYHRNGVVQAEDRTLDQVKALYR